MPKFTMKDEYPHVAQLAAEIGKTVSVIDIRTTDIGKPPSTIGIVEFAIISVFPDGHSVHYATLLKPRVEITTKASRLHGIWKSDTDYAPLFSSIADSVRRVFQDRLVTGFNICQHAYPILRDHIQEYTQEKCPDSDLLDTRLIYNQGNAYGTGRLWQVAHEYGVVAENAHRALGAVTASAAILEKMIVRNGVDWVADKIIHGQSVRISAKKPIAKTIKTSTPAKQKAEIRKPLRFKYEDVPVEDTTERDLADAAMCSVIENLGHSVTPEDYPAISSMLEEMNVHVQPNRVSYALGSMLNRGAAPIHLLVDDSIQEDMRPHLKAILDAAVQETPPGYALLKQPIKAQLESLGVQTDYVQLKIAIDAYINNEPVATSHVKSRRTTRFC